MRFTIFFSPRISTYRIWSFWRSGFSRFKIPEIRAIFNINDILVNVEELCCVSYCSEGKGSKENLHNHNTSHGTVHTKIATEQVSRFRIVAKYFRCCKFRCAWQSTNHLIETWRLKISSRFNVVRLEIGKRSLLHLISFLFLKIPFTIKSEERELLVSVIVKHWVIVLHEIHFISALCDMWGSSGIACLDLWSCLEETVYCSCENGRESDMFNLRRIVSITNLMQNTFIL